MDLGIPTETTIDFLIRVGLYIGAIFQLTCIFAIIILPDKNCEVSTHKKRGQDAILKLYKTILMGDCDLQNHVDVSDQENWDSPPLNPPRNFQHKTRKQDKKKRR